MTRSTGNSKHSSSLHPRRDPSSGRRGAGQRVRTTTKLTAPATPIVGKGSRWATGRDVALALVMAIGLSTVFLSPLRFSGTSVPAAVPVSGERVLGASISVPLTVTVSIKNGEQVWRTSVTPTTEMLAEVLARAANVAGSTFEYQSRGSSIYLTRFLDLPDDTTGMWIVRVNGVAVSDLSQVTLEQADEITVERRVI